MNTEIGTATFDGKLGSNMLREPEINKSTETIKPSKGFLSRRSFLGKSLAVGAGTVGAGLLANAPTARASGGLTAGDKAILRFLAAAELIEADLWQQYNELGGIQDSEVPGGTGNPAYTAAIEVLDEDMDQYIHDNTDDEITHAAFLNAYLTSKGAEPVNLDQFRTLPSSQATGAQSRVISADVLATKVRTDTFCWLLSVSRCRGTSVKRLADWQRANGCHEQFVVATRREGYASAHVFS